MAEAPAAIMRKLIQDPMYSFSGYRDQVTNDETGQDLGIDAIVLQLAFGDEPHSTWAANDDLVTERLEETGIESKGPVRTWEESQNGTRYAYHAHLG